jgi:hypothetical protein
MAELGSWQLNRARMPAYWGRYRRGRTDISCYMQINEDMRRWQATTGDRRGPGRGEEIWVEEDQGSRGDVAPVVEHVGTAEVRLQGKSRSTSRGELHVGGGQGRLFHTNGDLEDSRSRKGRRRHTPAMSLVSSRVYAGTRAGSDDDALRDRRYVRILFPAPDPSPSTAPSIFSTTTAPCTLTSSCVRLSPPPPAPAETPVTAPTGRPAKVHRAHIPSRSSSSTTPNREYQTPRATPRTHHRTQSRPTPHTPTAPPPRLPGAGRHPLCIRRQGARQVACSRFLSRRPCSRSRSSVVPSSRRWSPCCMPQQPSGTSRTLGLLRQCQGPSLVPPLARPRQALSLPRHHSSASHHHQ